MEWIIVFLTLLAGFLMPVQPAVNAMVAQVVKSPYISAFLSFLVGTLALGFLVVLQRTPWPPIKDVATLPWWVWTGGFMGAFFVTMTIVAIPRLGATSIMALLVSGQMLFSLLLDHYGWLGVPAHPINIWRVLGAALLLSGVVLIRKF